MPTTKRTTYKKLDPNTIEITEEITTIETVVSTYLVDDLISARDKHVTDKQVLAAQKDNDIALADAVIAEATNLGIVPVSAANPI